MAKAASSPSRSPNRSRREISRCADRRRLSSASPPRSSGWRRSRPLRPTSPPPTPLSGIRTAAGLRRSRGSTVSTCRCSRASTGCATCWWRTPSALPRGCPPTTRCCGARAAWASRRWSRPRMPRSMPPARKAKSGPLKLIEIHREDIESLPELMALIRGAPLSLHRVLRRSVLRRRRHLLQVAQGAAGRRHRRPAGQCDLLRHLKPPPPDVARHDGERALDRDQSGRNGGGESVAVRPLRALARLSPLQPGRISGDGRGLCRPLQNSGAAATSCSARRWNGRRRAARAPAASPGNTFRIWPDGSAWR